MYIAKIQQKKRENVSCLKKLVIAFCMIFGLFLLTACGKEQMDEVNDSTGLDSYAETVEVVSQDSIAVEEQNIDWKFEYAGIVKAWYEKHHCDYTFGYRLLYMNDDDIPELCLIGDLEGWVGIDIYTVDDSGVRCIAKDFFCRANDYQLICYEKSGYYACSSFMMGKTLDFYSFDSQKMMDDQNMDEPVLSYWGKSQEFYGNETDETIVEYIDAAGNKQIKEYPAYYELNDIPDVSEIKELLHVDDFSENNTNYVLDNIISYEDICRELGIDMDTNVPDDAIYGILLNKFYDPYMSYDYDQKLVIESCLEALPFCEGMMFAIADINKDGIEELLIPDCVGEPSDSGDVRYNMFIPNEDWNEAKLISFHYYDPETGNIAEKSDGLGASIRYYTYQNGVYDSYDYYENVYGDTYIPETDSYEEVNEYYHGQDENAVQINEEEYNKQAAFTWEGLNVEWRKIDKENIDALFSYHAYE